MRTALAVLAAAFMTVVAVVMAPSTQAAGVWHQSVGRANGTAACPDPTFGTPWQDNWNPSERPWRPSWSQWMNGGTGGFTCDRQITWAAGPYPSAGCLLYDDDSMDVYYVDFAGGWSLGDTVRYNDAACTSIYNVDINSTYPAYVVFAPAGYDGPSLCREAFGSRVLYPLAAGTNGIWTCIRPPV